jgi:hypothetical protein
MFCTIYNKKSNKCIDISGENFKPGGKIITYECSSKWNQLFRFLPDYSISAVQPEVISKVRDFSRGLPITLCIVSSYDSKSNSFVLVTDKCNNEQDKQKFSLIDIKSIDEYLIENNNNNNNNNNIIISEL